MLNYSTTDLSIFLGKAEVKLTELGEELYKQLTYGEASEGLVDDINLLSDILDEIEVSTDQDEIDILVNFALDYYNLVSTAYSPFNVLPTTIIATGGVSSHEELTDVSILSALTIPSGDKAWHLNDLVAQDLLTSLYNPTPPVQAGLFFTVAPGNPIINPTSVEETSSEISYNTNIYVIPADTLTFSLSASGKKRYDAVAVDADAQIYVIITGEEVDEDEAIPSPVIPANHLFVRFIEVNDSESVIVTGAVKSIYISDGSTLYPDVDGLINLELAILEGDARLVNTRTPTDGTVTPTKLSLGTIITTLLGTDTLYVNRAGQFRPIDWSNILTILGALYAAKSIEATVATNTANIASNTTAIGTKLDKFEAFSDLPVTTSSTTWATASKYVNNKTSTLTSNTTISFTGLINGAEGTWFIKQDATGNRTITVPANSKPSMTTLDIALTANAETMVGWKYDGTNIHWAIKKYGL